MGNLQPDGKGSLARKTEMARNPQKKTRKESLRHDCKAIETGKGGGGGAAVRYGSHLKPPQLGRSQQEKPENKGKNKPKSKKGE